MNSHIAEILMFTFGGISLLLGIIVVLLLIDGRGKSQPTKPDETDSLRKQIAELNRLIGEQDSAHAAEIRTVKSEAASEVKEYKTALDLEFAERKREAARSTTARSRQALVAKIGEHVAPLLGDFPYNPKEVRHVGEVFDFLVYDGLEDPEADLTVVFLEVKTKASGARVTNVRERRLRDAVSAGRVRYEVYVPDVSAAKNDS